MKGLPRLLALLFLILANPLFAEHVIVSGGPTLRKWENLRVPEDQHDRFWGNFIAAASFRMDEIRTAYGSDAKLVWIVYKPGYQTRGREDGRSYTDMIANQAAKRKASLIWVSSSGDLIRALNSRPRGSVETFDYFGHSNKYAFMLDYGNDIMAVSTAVLHERDLSRIKSSIFSRNAYCKSWGCHTGESMSAVWKSSVGMPLEGAKGPTSYVPISQGKMPSVNGSWVR